MKIYKELDLLIKGDICSDEVYRILYATDASVYRNIPEVVVFPKSENDLAEIVVWAVRNGKSIIPRGAGTSLAGQVVGSGVVIDTGRYLNKILSINKEEKSVWVEPGVVRDDLNRFLKPYNLYYAPETSTSNRCMISGMVGNNSCGANSLVYGSVRDHIMAVKGVLSDGSLIETEPMSVKQLMMKCSENNREGDIYRFIIDTLNNDKNRAEIENNAPHSSIKRKNTGYALEALLKMQPFTENGKPFNLSELIAGSEGTLMLMSAIKLSLIDISHKASLLLCINLHKLEEAFEANLIALKYDVHSIELIDNVIIDCTENHPGLSCERFFIKDKPKAVLIVELNGESINYLNYVANNIISDLKSSRLGYHYYIAKGEEIYRVWALRKAGLGLLSNTPHKAKPVAVVEDTAVRPEDLSEYISEFKDILKELNVQSVFFGHIGSGALHIRPILNLKNSDHIKLFRQIAERSVRLVKKYKGSLSSEHGDGKLRGEFIPLFAGERVYRLYCELKKVFDPLNSFNPGKIVNSEKMDSSFRYSGSYHDTDFKTVFNYEKDGGFLSAIERCNGSGDCRKERWYPGNMCPSYHATKDEKLSTRGRANFIREILSRGSVKNRSVKEVLDKCLSCKSCKIECPSAIDMAKYKSEVMHLYYKHNNIPFSVWLLANMQIYLRVFRFYPRLYNFFISLPGINPLVKYIAGIHKKREIPLISSPTVTVWWKKNKNYKSHSIEISEKRKVYLFIDEFTDYFDAERGIKTIKLLSRLGYDVVPICGVVSGRAAFSAGLLKQGEKYAKKSVEVLKEIIQEDSPLIGIEPSAFLTLRDEYTEILCKEIKTNANKIASNSYLIEEFISEEFERGRITSNMFTSEIKRIVYHEHCHYKATGLTGSLKKMLEIPDHYVAEPIEAGCCGMGGTFGMEKMNYNLSMSIGEMSLFPYIRNLDNGIIVAISGIGCRKQVKEGTKRNVFHPVDILYDALLYL